MRKSNTQIMGIGEGFLVKETGNVFNKIIKIIPYILRKQYTDVYGQDPKRNSPRHITI